jgi:serine/threonine protein kinase/WD40 repeat protein
MGELPNRDSDVTIVRETDIYIEVNLRRSARTRGSHIYKADGTRSLGLNYMSDPARDNLSALDIDLARRIDEVCRRFEADWREGRQPRIDDYLVDVLDEGRPALRAELSALEGELRKSEVTMPRPEAGSDTSPEPQKAPPPSTLAEATTVAPGTAPVSPLLGAATSDIHDEATLPPRDGATVDHSPADSAQPDGAALVRIRYFGDYEILREIARGGMGVVFHARQISLNRPVALKMILAGQLADETDVKRFHTEAEAAANLDHPGIVPIFEVGQHQGQHYFSMGFVEGESLSHRLADGPLPAREAAELIRRVSEAIDYAHRRGVIHRDLKPGNILLDQHGNPRVTDFGLAKRIQGDSGLTGSGQIMGTPSYMPPEQAGGQRGEVGPAADVYALGATLYALLTGRPPFQAATPMDTVIQVINDEPVSPRRLNASIPLDLETICLKCLEKESPKRYTSAAALQEDLRHYLAGEPIQARPVGRPERLWRWSRRNPALAASLFIGGHLLLIVALLASGIALLQSRRARESRDSQGQLQSTLGRVSEQRERADRLRLQAEHDVANAYLDRGLAMAVDPDHRENEGLLWMARALRRIPSGSENEGLRTAARANLAYWGSRREYYEEPFKRLGGKLWTAAYGPDGRQLFALATDPDEEAAINRNRPGEMLFRDKEAAINRPGETEFGPLVPSAETIVAVFSRDGHRVVTGHGDNSLRVWDADTRRLICQPKRGERKTPDRELIMAVAFSPDGRRVAESTRKYGLLSNRYPSIRMWDADSGAAVGRDLGALPTPELGRPFGAVDSLNFTADGRWLVARSLLDWNRDDPFSRLFDAAAVGPVPRSLRHLDGSKLLTAAPDGRRFVTAIWDEERVSAARDAEFELITARPRAEATGETTQTPEYRTWYDRWKKAHDAAVTEPLDNTSQLWDAGTGAAVGKPLLHRGHVRRILFSPDSLRFATVGGTTVRLGDAATGASVGPAIESPDVNLNDLALAFRPDGKILAIGHGDATVTLHDTATGHAVGVPWRAVVRPKLLAFSPDGAYLLAGQTNEVRLYEPATGKLIGRPMRIPNHAANVQFSPDGRQLFARSNHPVHPSHFWVLDSPVPDDPERVEAWIETLVGGTLDTEAGIVRGFDEAAQRRAKEHLDRLGGPLAP